MDPMGRLALTVGLMVFCKSIGGNASRMEMKQTVDMGRTNKAPEGAFSMGFKRRRGGGGAAWWPGWAKGIAVNHGGKTCSMLRAS
ncbi:MAG: hypothetical protein ACOYI4_00065 [Christensenellales bacterium]|jgi:hypothetical protein